MPKTSITYDRIDATTLEDSYRHFIYTHGVVEVTVEVVLEDMLSGVVHNAYLQELNVEYRGRQWIITDITTHGTIHKFARIRMQHVIKPGEMIAGDKRDAIGDPAWQL